LVFENNDDWNYGLMSKDNLIKIKSIEKMVTEHKYWTSLCFAQSIDDQSCAKDAIVSPLTALALAGMNTSRIEDYTQQEISFYFYQAVKTPYIWNTFKQFYDSEVSLKNLRVNYMRNFVNLGAPIEIEGVRYNDKTDRLEEQTEYVSTFLLDLEAKFIESFENDPTGFEVNILSEAYNQKVFQDLVTGDTAWSIFSVMFVFGYLCYHLSSLFLASVGIMLILLSFPLTSFITEGIFRVTYFSNLHSLVIFLVLGIAADDIFVFFDAWRQSERVSPEIFGKDRKKRMAYSFRRAVRAMAVTSSTTSAAFFANAFSPLMPIKAFGIYAGVIIPVNYFLVCFFFPPATILYERHINGRCSKICKGSQDKTTDRVRKFDEKDQGSDDGLEEIQ
jgi:hypothetical protein